MTRSSRWSDPRACARGRRFALKTRRGVQEESKRKKYRCVCWVLGKGADARYGGTHSEICVRNKGSGAVRRRRVTEEDLRRKLDSVRDLKVAQTTPIRVAHRRTGAPKPLITPF